MQRPTPKIVVLLGQPGAAPTLKDRVDYLVPISLERTAGGKRVDTIVLEYDLAKRNERVVDITAPVGLDREIEVVELNDKGEIRRTLAWGKIGVQPTTIVGGNAEEKLQLKVRLDHHLFDDIIVRTPFWDESTQSRTFLDHEWIFNPEIDEKIEPNRSSHQETTTYDEAYYFVDPESLRTAGAESYQGQQAYLWTIAQAAHRLCWQGNATQPHVKNPTLKEIEADLKGIDDNLFRNHRIPRGHYLPRALDELLEPYGASWYITYDLDETVSPPERIRKIRFFRDGIGTERKLYMQRPVEALDPKRTNVADLNIDFSIVDLANEIDGCSSFVEREATFRIYPLWDPADDTIDIDELKNGTETNKLKPGVGRKFGINTDGSYDTLRPGLIPTAATFLTTLKDLLGQNCIARRHILKPCLSRVKNEEGVFESRGFWVEWENPDADGGPAMEKLPCSIHVSDKEAAIFISSEKVHEGIWDQIQSDPSSLLLQLTCTWTSDLRVRKTADREPTSPNGDRILLLLDLSDKFHDRRVAAESIFYGDGSADENTTAETEMEDYLKKVRSTDDSAEVGVTATLEGLDHPEYEIGQVVTMVEGRNLNFDANAAASATPRRLQIVGVNLSPPDMKTVVELETIQGDRP